ncbi:MAG TPA: dTMP kinase [Acidimicrobiales bacterium]|jgi:dTMP kinase
MSFIAFEGGEASGKSTQATRLARRLDAVLTREPGGTRLGEELRSLLLAGDNEAALPIDPRAEALLMAAARAQHVAEVIGPALATGRHVVTDRFTGSSLAYQGVGRGVGIGPVRALSEFATGGLDPDLTVVLRVAAGEAAARLSRQRLDRIESAGEAFHRAVESAYDQLAGVEPHWVVVDGSASPDAVEAAVWEVVRERLGASVGAGG